MQVEISREPKWSKVDHLFILLPEKTKAPRDLSLPKAVSKAISDSGFEGRSDESITLLVDEPRKVTLVGLGKEDAFSLRILRGALFTVGKIARRQRDKSIAVINPHKLPKTSVEETVRLTADYLAQTDYKYDVYLTTTKNEKPPAINAIVVAPASVETKRGRELQAEAAAVAEGIRTVRDLGNAPSNVMTATRLAERAEQVAKEVAVKCTVYGRKEIERMKMGGLIAVNRGSVEEPRFIVMEYAPRRAKEHVALVGKGITFDRDH